MSALRMTAVLLLLSVTGSLGRTSVIRVSDSFYNFRAEGFHASLVRLVNSDWMMLDCVPLDRNALSLVNDLTDNGRKLHAIANLHPRRNKHIEDMHSHFPTRAIRWFGTPSHLKSHPNIEWQSATTNSDEFRDYYYDSLYFTVPEGIAFDSEEQPTFFASVIATHWESKTIHVDDTLTYTPHDSPVKRLIEPELRIQFHSSLAESLKDHKGAAKAFRSWANHFSRSIESIVNLVSSYNNVLLERNNQGPSVSERVLQALRDVDDILDHHEDKFHDKESAEVIGDPTAIHSWISDRFLPVVQS